ncbi:MAG TPA: AMP-binding protein [Ramlibacter sp.]|nr:AMP-binding protein [Ramlibacter sp.]
MRSAPAMNLGQLLTQAARRFPQRTGVVDGERRFTWVEVNERVDRLAQGLADRGLAKGDRVMVQARNSHRMFELKWALFKLGAVWVPVNFRLAPAEAAFMAAHSGALAFAYDEEFRGHAQAARVATPSLALLLCLDGASVLENAQSCEDVLGAAAQPLAREATVAHDDPAWFFYTSGTTGRPKAAVLTHGQLAFVAVSQLADMFPGATEDDTSLVVAPLSHGAGVHALSFVARGATQVFPAHSDPASLWALVERHRVTNFFAVPTLVKTLVEHESVQRFDHGSLRFVNYGGAPMFRADLRLALQRLGPVLVQHYGLGEFTAAISVLPPLRQADNLQDADGSPVGSCGVARTGTEIVILDADGRMLPPGQDGEICARGPACFAGYHGDADATARAFAGGWFHTGDLGRLDASGRLFITGRASDMYITGGLNVHPREVEELLLEDPRVAEAAVVGVPHPRWGESGVAVIVLREGAQARDDELLARLDGRLARFKRPARVLFWPQLPKSGYGKILKREIVRQLATEVLP